MGIYKIITMKYSILLALVATVAGRRLHHHKHHQQELVQTGDYFYPFDKGMLGGAAYERVIPAHFGGDGDDLFMRSVLKNYALEGKDEDTEKPTGKFTLDETQAKALATEVLGTHKGLTGANLKNYMDTYWAKAWGHFDVNRSGSIEAIRAPQLMRFLASDQYFQL